MESPPMNRRIGTSAVAMAIAAGWALPAHAASENEEVLRQLAAMRGEMAQLEARVNVLEGQLVTEHARADAAEAKASAALAEAQAARAAAAANTSAPRSGLRTTFFKTPCVMD